MVLADQDRSRWNRGQIEEGRSLLDRAIALQGRGPYVLQAAIATLQADDPIDWRQVAALYGELADATNSPVVELNRAVAIAEWRAWRRRWRSSTRLRLTTTSICTRPGPTCCGASDAPTRPAPPTSGRFSWPVPRPSGDSWKQRAAELDPGRRLAGHYYDDCATRVPGDVKVTAGMPK